MPRKPHPIAECLDGRGPLVPGLSTARPHSLPGRQTPAGDDAVGHHLLTNSGRAGHRGEALETAREAVAAYRSLVRRHPEDFSRGLAGALRTYASVLEWVGREADAARIRQESEAMTEETALEDSIRGF